MARSMVHSGQAAGCRASCSRPGPVRTTLALPVTATSPSSRCVAMRSTGWADPAATTAEKSMFGENFGARDPFAAEIESNFGDKVLGHYNTDHIIKVPTKIGDHVGLSARELAPAAELAPLEEKELNLLKQQVPGWKVVTNAAGQQAIRHDWRLRSPEAATTLRNLIVALPVAQQHKPAIVVSGELLSAELSTAAVSGLSVNDFVVAARINMLDVKELVPPPRKRFWA